MAEADDLVAAAQKQLDEHKEWLALEIHKAQLPVAFESMRMLLVGQALDIKLRVARGAARVVSVVWEYPDELYAFLRSERAPEHLRATLAGGHVVDPNQPAFMAKRVES